MDDTAAQTGQKDEPNTKKGTLRIIGAIAASFVFFNLVSPTAVPLVMLVVGFVMLGLLFYGVLKLVLLITGLQTKLRPMQRRAIVLLGVFLPLLLIMLQSLGQLTIRDVLTLGGLFVVGVFYILRLGKTSTPR